MSAQTGPSSNCSHENRLLLPLLPVELYQIILAYALSDDATATSDVASVCRGWRSLCTTDAGLVHIVEATRVRKAALRCYASALIRLSHRVQNLRVMLPEDHYSDALAMQAGGSNAVRIRYRDDRGKMRERCAADLDCMRAVTKALSRFPKRRPYLDTYPECNTRKLKQLLTARKMDGSIEDVLERIAEPQRVARLSVCHDFGFRDVRLLPASVWLASCECRPDWIRSLRKVWRGRSEFK